MQVLGCQSRRLTAQGRTSSNDIQPGSSTTQRDQWPADNGTACLCYDTLDAECIATCAAGIRNYNIRQSSGTGLVTAKCPGNTMVLGCGSSAETAGQSSYRAAVVAMRKSCRCYDDQGVTCYAVCGLFTAESSYPDSFPAARLLVPDQKRNSAVKFHSNSASKMMICVLALCLMLILSKQSWVQESQSKSNI